MLIPQIRYRVACDTCFTCYQNRDGETLFISSDEASSDGWQTADDMHYCPEHVHVYCERCLKTSEGSLIELKRQGWHYVTLEDTQAMCARCFMKEGANYA